MSQKPNPYRNAIGIIQGASNCLGITKSLAEDMQTLADDLREKGAMSTEKLNQHPVMRLYLEQLVHLCVGVMIPEGKPTTDYFTASTLCQQMIPIWDEQHPRDPEAEEWFEVTYQSCFSAEGFRFAQLCEEQERPFRPFQIRGQRLRIYEGSTAFWLFDPVTNDERCLGDGVDRYFWPDGDPREGQAYRVGTREFYRAMMFDLMANESQLGEAYNLPKTDEQETRVELPDPADRVLPGDGYADGGAPYTDEELAIINGEGREEITGQCPTDETDPCDSAGCPVHNEG